MSPADWYPDPWQPTRWRYFDGTGWTGYTHPPQIAPMVPSAMPTSVATSMRLHTGANPSQWWWAGGTLLAVFAASMFLAWSVSR